MYSVVSFCFVFTTMLFFTVESNMIMCHICNVASQVDNLIENRFLAKLLEDDSNIVDDEVKDTDEETKCTSCHDNVNATSWCVECEEFICPNCVMVSINCLLNGT